MPYITTVIINGKNLTHHYSTNFLFCGQPLQWRRIPSSKTSELPPNWNCSMNTDSDPDHSKCSDPQEEYNKGLRIQSGTTPKASDFPDAEKADVAIVGSMNENSAMTTKQANNKVKPDTTLKQSIPSFVTALPTYTHRALTHLILQPPPKSRNNDSEDNTVDEASTPQSQRTYLHHIITQNIDGLHRKSCLPRKHQSILHGDIFTEVCDTCHTEHVRPYEISSIGLSYTGRECTLGGNPAGSCKGKLKDTLLDWESDLPEVDWAKAQEECHNADLIICLGTSLRIEPAASLCTFARPDLSATTREEKTRNEKKLGYVIVNLQKTPYDDQATLVVRGKVDDVMEGLMQRLGYERNWDDLFDYGKKI
jgi:mono-ADP-ribosyltransferase sirtuin 6